MPGRAGAVGEEDDSVGFGFAPIAESMGRVHVRDLSPIEGSRIERTSAQTSKISSLNSFSTTSLQSRNVEPLAEAAPEDAQLVEDLESIKTELEERQTFPFLAWESVKLALAKEKFSTDKIQSHVQEVEKNQKCIKKLINLSAMLSAHKQGPLTDEIKAVLNELKEDGVNLHVDENRHFDKHQIDDLKLNIGSQNSRLQSEIQVIMSTKVQVLIQQMSAIIQAVKNIIESNSRLVRKTLEHR